MPPTSPLSLRDLLQTVSNIGLYSNCEILALEPQEDKTTQTVTPQSWEDLEAQREMAFKIVYFFMGLIAITFGALYVYFKL